MEDKTLEIWKRQKEILSLLKKGNPLTPKELADRFRVSERTITSDIKQLAYRGFQIPRRRRGSGSFHLDPKESALDQNIFNYFDYEPITEDTISKWAIMDILRKNDTSTLGKITSEFNNIYQFKNYDGVQKAPSTIKEKLSELVKENLVREQSINRSIKVYTLSSDIATIMFSPDDIISFFVYCSNKGIDLQSLKNKMSVYGYIAEQNMFSLSRQTTGFVSSAKAILDLYDIFSHKAIRFTYGSEKKQVINQFYVGKIFYSKDNDTMYLMGTVHHTSADKDWKLYKFNLIQLETIEALEKENLFFNCDEVQQVFDEMFSNPDKQSKNILVRLYLTDDTLPIIKRLYCLRKKTCHMYTSDAKRITADNIDSITVDSDYIIYKDICRDLGGTAKYLRLFGDKIIVREGFGLAKQLHKTASLALKIYEPQKESTKETAKEIVNGR